METTTFSPVTRVTRHFGVVCCDEPVDMRRPTLFPLLAALLAATLLVTSPAQAGGGIGEQCEKFRGAKRCANWYWGGGSGDELVPSATTTIAVRNGADAEVKLALMQRRTPTGWVTIARNSGSGVRGSYASAGANAGDCGDLKKGTYRSRGKVSWTSEGVRYTRWITGTPVKRGALC